MVKPLLPRHVSSMPAGTSRPGRALRVGVFAGVSLLLAIAAHRLAGGMTPSGTLVWPAAAGLVGVGWLASRRERSGRFLATLVAANQALLHLAFAAPLLISAIRARGSSGPGLTLAQLLLCHDGPSVVTSAQLHAVTSNLDPAALAALTGHSTAAHAAVTTGQSVQMVLMLAAHLVAAAAVAWWLRRGERVACRVAQSALARVLDDGPRPLVARTVSLVICLPVAARAWRWLGAVAGRGPPRPCTSLLFQPV